MTIDQRFVLHDDGQWMYYLAPDIPVSWLGPGGPEPVPLADGQPMTQLRDGWWVTDREAAEIAIRIPQSPKRVSWRLRDQAAASEKFPARLTPAEWEERGGTDLMWELYESVTEPQPDKVTTVPGPWISLDGAPPPEDGRSWVANLPDALRNRPEYHHLVPGYMPGFKEHIKKLAEQHPHQQFVFIDYQGQPGVQITLEVPFDKPITEYRAARNRNGSISKTRPGRTIQVTATRRLHFPVPDRIPGANRAEAAAEWDRLTAEYQAALGEASVAACSACHGHGHVPTGAEQYEKGRA